MNRYSKIMMMSFAAILLVTSVASAKPYTQLKIINNTGNFLNSVSLSTQFVSLDNSKTYSDYENIDYFTTSERAYYIIYRPLANCQSSPCTGDFFYLSYAEYNQNPSYFSISRPQDGESYSNTTISITFYINGNCYTDWEDVGSWGPDQDIVLYLDTSGAQWSNGCYRGNLLHS
jgi:hypothetical protein